jgi:hypothetical protein
MVFKWCYSGVSMVLQWCYNDDNVVSQRCCDSYTMPTFPLSNSSFTLFDLLCHDLQLGLSLRDASEGLTLEQLEVCVYVRVCV